jgi:hypothetical protein
MKIVFVHGRSQAGKNKQDLLNEWLQAAISGITDAHLPALPILSEANVALPYYGDILFELTQKAGRDAYATLVNRGADTTGLSAEEIEFTQAIVLELAESEVAKSKGISLENIGHEAGMPVDRAVQNWPAVLAALRLLENVPGISESVIEFFTRDVWYYLTNKGLRLQIDKVVDADIPDEEPCVIVAHSLGTIVAYNLLMNRKRNNIKGLITIGSPLGIEAIYDRLPSDTLKRTTPVGLPRWFNALDKKDTVALHKIPPDKYPGDPIVENNRRPIMNGSENHHGIVEYLRHEVVANEIHRLLSNSA